MQRICIVIMGLITFNLTGCGEPTIVRNTTHLNDLPPSAINDTVNPRLLKPEPSPIPLPPDLSQVPVGKILVTLAIGQTGTNDFTANGCLWIYFQTFVDEKTLGDFQIDTRQNILSHHDPVRAGGLLWRGTLKPVLGKPDHLAVHTDVAWNKAVCVPAGRGEGDQGFLLQVTGSDFTNDSICSLNGFWKCVGGLDFHSQATHRKHYTICIRIDRGPDTSPMSTTTTATKP